jgi:hypothetical protein
MSASGAWAVVAVNSANGYTGSRPCDLSHPRGKDAFERAARYSGLSLSAWLRITIREATERRLANADTAPWLNPLEKMTLKSRPIFLTHVGVRAGEG